MIDKIILKPEKLSDCDDANLIALMGACNDLQTATKCLLEWNKKSTTDETEEKILSAERVYFLRLITAHLNEGLNLFYNFHQNRKATDVIKKFDKKELEDFNVLKIASALNSGLRLKYLKGLRNDSIFHYNEQAINKSLVHFCEEAKSLEWKKIIIKDRLFDSRYLIADNVLAGIFWIKASDNLNKLEQLLKDVRDIQFNLARFLRSFLAKSGKLRPE